MWSWHLISQNEHMKLWKNKYVYKFVIHSLNAFDIVMKQIDKMSFAQRRRGRKVHWDHPGACLCLPLVELPCQQYSRCVTYRLWAGKVKSRGSGVGRWRKSHAESVCLQWWQNLHASSSAHQLIERPGTTRNAFSLKRVTGQLTVGRPGVGSLQNCLALACPCRLSSWPPRGRRALWAVVDSPVIRAFKHRFGSVW